MPRGYTGSTPGVNPKSQGEITRRFKRKKIFVTETGNRTDGRTDRRDSRNSDVDLLVKSRSTRKLTMNEKILLLFQSIS